MLPTWTPDLLALDLLLSVAEHGSLGRAAEAHGISQPSASGRLAHLERRLGITLLVRTTRGSTLTPRGEAVVAWAADVVAVARNLTDGVSALRNDSTVRLRVAASLTIAEYLLPSWLLRLRRDHPDLDIAVTVANSHAVVAAVLAGTEEIGFVESPTPPPELRSEVVAVDRLVLLVSPGHALAGHTVDPTDLRGLPLLLREPGSGTRDTFLTALSSTDGQPADARLTRTTTLGSTATILATARAGVGIGVVSDRAAATDLAAGSLVPIVVPGLDLARELRVVWNGPPQSRPGSPADKLVCVARQTPSEGRSAVG